MRILTLLHPGVAGCGIVAVELGHELARRSHEIHFVSHDPPFRLDLGAQNIFFHRVPIEEFDLFKYSDYILPLLNKTVEVAKRFEIDVIHAHYAVPHAIVATLARDMLSSRPRVVTTLHGTDITLLAGNGSYGNVVKHAIEMSDAVTAVSGHLVGETNKTISSRKPITLIPNFPPAKVATAPRQSIRDSIGVKDEDFLLIHISNLRALKRVNDILRAIPRCKSDPKLLILAGGSPSESESYIAENGLSSRVVIKENVIDVENYIHAADAGIYASEREECSLAMLETMANEKPLIATATGGTPELIGDSGLLCQLGDIDKLADHIDTLSENHELRARLGRRAKRRVETDFSRLDIVEKYLAAYAPGD
jgi:N-acetyl-alpha-D-glucosaminyl L-malate synthase BshA